LRDLLFIDGAWVPPAEGFSFEVIDPATGAAFQRVARGTAADIERAVMAARRAFDDGPWPRMTGAERGAVLTRMADLIAARIEDLAQLEVRDNGKPLPEARWDIEDTAGVFRYYAGLAAGLDTDARDIALSAEGFSCTAVREPVGVAGAIIPWNYPMLMASWKVAPAFAAGCCMVLKPSELTPLTALELAAIAAEAGVPPGVLNVVTGFGAEAGQALADHPGVDKLAFTGSVPTGSKILQAAARDIKAVSLELGGKSPLVVFADTPLDEAVEWILFGIFWNQGQVCSATSRVLVEDSLYPALLERLAAETAKIRIGNGLEDGVLLGPLVSEGQRAKVLEAIARGRAEGARVLAGGGVPAGLHHGWFMEPTILADVPEHSWVWREEIFGPVVCLRPFVSEAEAIRSANDSRFGLAAAVMSADLDRAERVARAFRVGIVWINCSQPTFTEAPWGGMKQSGIGRELGEWGLANYLETKQITRWDRHRPWGWYIKE
jgi:betaine-aldehyde dehydrogenase